MSCRSQSQVISELFFFDDESVISVRLKQPVFAKSLHKHADPRPRRAHHLGQFIMRYLRFDAKAVRVFLAQCARQLQKRLAITEAVRSQ